MRKYYKKESMVTIPRVILHVLLTTTLRATPYFAVNSVSYDNPSPLFKTSFIGGTDN